MGVQSHLVSHLHDGDALLEVGLVGTTYPLRHDGVDGAVVAVTMAILLRGLRLGHLWLTDGEVGGIRGDGDVGVVVGETWLRCRLEDVAVVHLQVGEGELDVPIDGATLYERYAVDQHH